MPDRYAGLRGKGESTCDSWMKDGPFLRPALPTCGSRAGWPCATAFADPVVLPGWFGSVLQPVESAVLPE